VRSQAVPSGEVIVRDCYGYDARQRLIGGELAKGEGEASFGDAGGNAQQAPMGGAPPPAAKPKMSPKPRPAPSPERSSRGLGRNDAGPGGGGAPVDAPAAEPVAAEPASPPPATASKDRRGGDDGKPMEQLLKSLEAMGYVSADDDASARDANLDLRKAKREEQKNDLADAEVPQTEEEPDAAVDEVLGARELARRTLDWGATVYLSNDDSMSLASAQRTLYALKRHQRLSPSEVRPHELLNYFSFDVAPVDDDQLFSVLGAAEHDGDTLSVSLAVRGANPERPPLDLTLALDRSCSMRQEGRMEYTKRGLSMLSSNLQDGDRVDVVLFDSGVCTPLENFVVGRDDPRLLDLTISQLSPKGSTDLDGGLREAYRIQAAREAQEVAKRNQRVVLLTDAELNTGNVDEDLVSEVGRQFESHGIRLTGIGVGRTFNDTMLDKLTEKGKGAYVYLGSEAVVDRVFGPGFDALTRTIAHDVQFSVELPDSLAMERFYGEEASTVAADVQPIHYYAGTTQLFLQDLAVRDGSLVLRDPVRMRIRYVDAATGEPGEQVLHTTVGALLEGDRHNLRKGQALMAFADVATAWAMGAGPCGAPLSDYRGKAARVSDDAEIAYTNSLLGDLCGVDLSTVVEPGVAYKVKVDSDMPIAEVALQCPTGEHRSALGGADTVARFDAVVPGSCVVQLQGTVPMRASVRVPETGGDVRCMVRGGRLSCG
jgi:Ca-activated chloride channel family protein